MQSMKKTIHRPSACPYASGCITTDCDVLPASIDHAQVDKSVHLLYWPGCWSRNDLDMPSWAYFGRTTMHAEWRFLVILSHFGEFRGTRQRSWLRHYAISRRDAGSNTDKVIGFFFSWLNSSSHATALRLTQHLTEMSTRQSSWGVKRGWNERPTASQPSVNLLRRKF
jgi:hypothetical protein